MAIGACREPSSDQDDWVPARWKFSEGDVNSGGSGEFH
jgi:hypothetical protein